MVGSQLNVAPRPREAIRNRLQHALTHEPANFLTNRVKRFVARNVFRWLPVRVGPARMYMNPSNTMSLVSYVLDTYEWRELSFARALVQPGDTVLDVGANIGYYTLNLARWVGPSGTVYAFEPDPTNFAILQKNVSVNSLKNVRIHNCALTDYDGDAILYRSKDNTGDYSLTPRFDDAARPVPVMTRRLDTLARELERTPSFLKIDVQGFEPSVLLGGSHSLDRWKPKPSILFEFEPALLVRAGFAPADLLRSLAARHYRIGQVTDHGLIEIDQFDFENFSRWAGASCNLLAIAGEGAPVGLVRGLEAPTGR